MPTHTTRPPFGEAPQGQPAEQAAPSPTPRALTTTRAMAERHEALWLALTALHRDVLALGAKKAGVPVPDGLRILAEGLLSDAAPFIGPRRNRLPVAAPELGGLAAQLGQALAMLAAWESRRSSIDARYGCLMWRVDRGQLPIMRLKPPLAAMPVERRVGDLREKLSARIDGQRARDFENGFRAGRAARQGRPLAEISAEFKETYPRLRMLD